MMKKLFIFVFSLLSMACAPVASASGVSALIACDYQAVLTVQENTAVAFITPAAVEVNVDLATWDRKRFIYKPGVTELMPISDVLVLQSGTPYAGVGVAS